MWLYPLQTTYHLPKCVHFNYMPGAAHSWDLLVLADDANSSFSITLECCRCILLLRIYCLSALLVFGFNMVGRFKCSEWPEAVRRQSVEADFGYFDLPYAL